MKIIELRDEDYDLLMELSKELQLQENHSQAFPYFWEPASEKRVVNIHDEGEIKIIFDNCQSETYEPDDYAEHNPSTYNEFVITEEIEGIKKDEDDNYIYSPNTENEWVCFLETNYSDDLSFFSEDWEQKTDHNPSLFLSDVNGYIVGNKHHLGRNPHTYARSVWRMPKMEALVKAIYRLNPQKEEDVNHEARRFVFEK